jgi:uncharacterized protein YegL
MPADRITSNSPWHVVLVIDDSGSMSDDKNGPSPASQVNEGLKSMVAEMEVIAKGTKPYFKISIIAFGDDADLISEATGERDIDINSIAIFSGSRGLTKCSEAFIRAAEVLKRNPGKDTDFRPYVFFFSDGCPNADDVQLALDAAADLKRVSIPAGAPTIVALGYGAIDHKFMAQVASNRELFKELPDAAALVKFFPAIGTIAGTKTGESAVNTAIMNL